MRGVERQHPVSLRDIADLKRQRPAPADLNNLGSTTMLTNHAGAESEEVLYYPWGNTATWRLQGGGGGNFAEIQYQDPNSGTNIAPNRFQSPTLGRWLSPDPLGGDVTNPQSLNRYPYVMNNPATLVDPQGLYSEQNSQSNPGEYDPCSDPNYVGAECGGPGWPPGFWPRNWPPGGFPLPGPTVSLPTGNPGGTRIPSGMANAFLGFHILCSQATIIVPGVSSTTSPANCVLSFLGVPLGSFSMLGSIAASGVVIAGSVTGIVPVAGAGGAGPTVQFAFSSQGWGCIGGGGAIGTLGKAFNVGPLTGGDLGNARNVLSGWSVSAGGQSANPVVGGQAVANSSGWVFGPTAGTPGGSISGTVSVCGNVP